MLQRSSKPKETAGQAGGPAGPAASAPQRQPRGNAAAAEALAAQAPVQAKGGAVSADAPALAREGTKGGGGRLPYYDMIQRSFGRHDVSDVHAAVGGAGGDSAKAMGAEAYASGDNVAFQGAPDLHTAAHEAAHVVQQRAGVRKPGGVGTPGDAHERHADAVADLVVQGRSAEALLDEGAAAGKGAAAKDTAAKAGDVVQMLPEKTVGSGAMRRLEKATEAIAHTKEVLSFGAGNQYEALKATNFNSYFRMAAMRDPECWEMAPSVQELAQQHPDALTAAMGELAKGGNCGEHAMIGFDYLRATAVGETINRVDVEGLDHAFVIMGEVKTESDASLAVCDPWPTAPTACVWEDHFAHTPDKTKINVRRSAKADGADVKSVIAAGLKLSAKGLAMIEQSFDETRTDEELKKGTSRENGAHPWIWNHRDASFDKYDYVEDTGR